MLKLSKNLIISLSVLLTSYWYPNDLNITTFPLLIYYIFNVSNNSWDMIIHHISAIMVGLSMNYSYNLEDITTTTIVARHLINTEIPSVFLHLIDIGYHNIIVKIGFIITFIYFRMIKLPWILIFDNETCYFCINNNNYICGSNDLCHILWSIGIFNILLINTIWYTKMMLKNNF
jgi:hypothetical protein